MTTLLNEEVITAFALPLLAAATHVARSTHKRLNTYAKAHCISRITRMLIANEDPNDSDIRKLRFRYTGSTISHSIEFLSTHLYGSALCRLDVIAEECNIDNWKYERVVFGDTAPFIMAHPDHAIHRISAVTKSFTSYEVAIFTQLLCRTGAPIAYTPMLISTNSNMQLTGIFLCERFTLTDAEKHLQKLIDSESVEIAYRALIALCHIHGDLSTSQVESAMRRMPPHLRISFVRQAVKCCYSLNACSHLLTREERSIFTQQLNSYKCQIVCN